MTDTRPTSTLSVHHLALLVDDIETADNFYRGVLGLAEEKRWFCEDGKTVRSIWLRTGENSRLMLEQAHGGMRLRLSHRGAQRRAAPLTPVPAVAAPDSLHPQV